MKNCIFCCVFYQEKYVEMFLLLLESIFLCGNLDETTDIVIYTSTEFMNSIKKSYLYNETKIKFETNDTYTNIDKSCKARLDVFDLPTIFYYNKILYLDTDIIVKDDINKVFQICKENILYVLEEGTIDCPSNYWGKSFFSEEELNTFKDKSAFTSGIMLFNNSETIKYLFEMIKMDIIRRPYKFVFFDQPYIVYNAFKYGMFDNKLLKQVAVNYDINFQSDKTIHHFPGGPGNYSRKIETMTSFLDYLKTVAHSTLNDTVHIEGDVWTCSHKMRTDIADFFVAKRNYKIAEIGAHKGYSTKILSKLFAKVYAVDNSTEWIAFNKHFNKDANNIEYVMLDLYRDPWDVLPENIEVSFIDAVHSYEGCKSDILNCIRRFKQLKYIIFDDYGVWPGVKKIVDEFLENKIFTFGKFIGINDVPGPHGIVKNVHEGIICSVNCNKLEREMLQNKIYCWENLEIKFLDNLKIEFDGKQLGDYFPTNEYNIIA
ncbi:MAG: hypothetical protein EBX50_20480, partial [Chitinophagia bacterium]|nr:hypothetical protein [Chitinophagia bacterium]